MNSATHRYGCHNRRPYITSYPAPNGHWLDGHTYTVRAESIKTTAQAKCQYTKSELGTTDKACTACKWRAEPKKAS